MARDAAPRAPLRELRHGLASARDDQIARILHVVDAMADRGAADALIAPLRPRLAALRPGRRPGFTRLLFTPLDPVIVPAARWRPGTPLVPRSCLAPLAAALRAALSGEAARIDAAIAACPTPELAAERVGPTLWAQAADVIGGQPPPARWREESGLPEAEHAPLARGIAAVLREAPAMQALVLRGGIGRGIPDDAIRVVLRRAIPAGQPAWGMILAVMAALLPQPERVMALALELAPDPGTRAAAEMSVDHLLDGLEDSVDGPVLGETSGLAATVAEAERIAGLAEGLDWAQQRPERRRRIEQLRRKVAQCCRARFEHGIESDLLGPVRDAIAAATDEDVLAFESAARHLRRLEALGRRLGAAEGFDAPLRRVCAALEATSLPGAAVTLVDRARIVEILAGSDAALRMLADQAG